MIPIVEEHLGLHKIHAPPIEVPICSIILYNEFQAEIFKIDINLNTFSMPT